VSRIRRAAGIRTALGAVVIVITALVLVGVGQGSPGAQIPISPVAVTAARARIAALGAEGRAGQADFASQGCNACHTIAASGYSGRLGPNLDAYLKGAPPAAIRQFILHPLTVKIPGFTHNLMPNNFSTRLTHDELKSLTAYLHAAAG
jgi:mono/diheme cytochrome c family protein